MDSITENKKRHKIEVHCQDRISELPADVASLILSYLDIQEAVRTGVLSTRWRNRWTLITTVDLDDKCPHLSKELRPIRREGFMDFAYQVLASVQCLHKLRIKTREDYDNQQVTSCIDLAARHEIRELDIEVRLGSSMISLPQHLFYCSELVVLKLERNFTVDIPLSVSLSKLKTLCLFEVCLEDEDSIDRLLAGCPILEELKMQVCVGENVRAVNISSPTLKKLTLIRLCFYDFDEHSFIECIVLHTPGLQYLVIDDYVVKAYSLNKLDHIIDAWIHIIDPSNVISASYSEAVIGLVDAVSNARTIKLGCNCFFKATGLYNHRFPKFPNLKCLDITTYLMEWTLFSKLLENSPYLETLGMVFESFANLPREEDAWGVPDCLQFCLKLIYIRTFRIGDTVAGARLANYFKREGKVLEEFC